MTTDRADHTASSVCTEKLSPARSTRWTTVCEWTGASKERA
jgi:hypothetical protein